LNFVARVGFPDGTVREELHEASDPGALRHELERRGLHVFELRRRGFALRLPGLGPGRPSKPVDQQAFMIFNQELAALLRAGLPLLQALDLLQARIQDPQFKLVMGEIRDRVKSGEELSDAFGHFGRLFPALYPSTLKAGERSGELEAVIRRFIRYQQLLLDARRRVISALVYPAVLITLSVGMIVIMLVHVVPRFTVFYADLEAELPLITRATLAVSDFLRDNLLWVALALVAGFLVLRQLAERPEGRIAIDRFKLRLPFVGPVFHRFALSEFGRSLATLLSGGIPLVPALEIAVKAVGNAFVRSRLEPTIQAVREGKPFYAALEASGVVEALAVDMVQVGEATGSLDSMLSSVSDFLDEDVQTRVTRLLSLLEPVMLVFMGVIVGVILVSVYLPMFSVLGEVK
jgi:type IV pilus assembly protein PilC